MDDGDGEEKRPRGDSSDADAKQPDSGSFKRAYTFRPIINGEEEKDTKRPKLDAEALTVRVATTPWKHIEEMPFTAKGLTVRSYVEEGQVQGSRGRAVLAVLLPADPERPGDPLNGIPHSLVRNIVHYSQRHVHHRLSAVEAQATLPPAERRPIEQAFMKDLFLPPASPPLPPDMRLRFEAVPGPPTLSTALPCPPALLKGMFFQAVSCMAWFHQHGYTFRPVLLPALLEHGAYCPGLSGDSLGADEAFPSRIACWSSHIMQVGGVHHPEAQLTAPEHLLGAKSRTTATDVWELGCLMNCMAANNVMFTVDDEAMLASQLMARLRTFGSIDLETWPSAVTLPHYQHNFPVWPRGSLRTPTDPALAALIRDMLCLAPGQRVGASDCLQHEYFRELREAEPGAAFDPEHLLEELHRAWMPPQPAAHMLDQEDLRVRRILLQWVGSIARELSCSKQCRFVAYDIIHQCLSRATVQVSCLQLLGQAALLLASKVCDPVHLFVEDVAYIGVPLETRELETALMLQLNGHVNHVTPVTFLSVYEVLLSARADEVLMAEVLIEAGFPFLYAAHSAECIAYAALCFVMKGVAGAPPANPFSLSGQTAERVLTDAVSALFTDLLALMQSDDADEKTRVLETSFFADVYHRLWESGEPSQRSTFIHAVDIRTAIQKNWALTQQHRAPRPASRGLDRQPGVTISLVFSYLSLPERCACMAVCKVFKRCAEHIQRRICALDIPRGSLAVLEASTLVQMHQRCRNLRLLSLEGCCLSRSHLNAILVALPNLTAISLANTEAAEDTVAPEPQSLVLQFPPGVAELDLNSCQLITYLDLARIFRHCQQLTMLRLGNLMGAVRPQTLTMLASSPSTATLTELSLYRTSFLDDQAVAALVARLPSIQSLYLEMCENISNTGVMEIARTCTGLRVLRLAASQTITDAAVIALAEHCPHLTDLSLSFCYLITTAAIDALAGQCRQLRHLNLCLLERMTDAAISAIALACPLESLNLRGCSRLTDACMTQLAQCNELKYLVLFDCYITAEGIDQLLAAQPDCKVIY